MARSAVVRSQTKALLWVVALTTICARGHAETPFPDPAATERTEAALREARAAQRARKWDDALRLYRKLWVVRKTYEIAANLGKVELQFNRHRDAVEHLAYALDNMPPDAPDALRDTVRQLVELATQNVGRILLTIEPGVTVLVDGAARQDWLAPSIIYVEPGTHTVSFNRAGYESATRVVTVAKGEALTVTIALRRLTPPSRPEPLPAPIERRRPNSEQHSPRSDAFDHEDMSLLLMGGGLTIAGIGAGVTMLGAAAQAEDHADHLRPSCAGCFQLGFTERDVRLYNRLALISFTGAGLVATGTIITYVLMERAESASEGRILEPLLIGSTLTMAGIVGGVLLLKSSASHDEARSAALDGVPSQDRERACGRGTVYVEECGYVFEEARAANANRGAAITSFVLAGAAAAGTTTYVLWKARNAQDSIVRANVHMTPNGATLTVGAVF